jgi:ubiquinol-cytochrome c reductase cytochrome c subunit
VVSSGGEQRERRGGVPRAAARRRPVLRLAGAALLLALVLLCAPARALAATPVASPLSGEQPASPAAGPVSGAAVFLQNCSGCHGPKGEGAFGPPLAPAGFAELVGPMVEQGGIQMPSFRNALAKEQVDAVAQYVAGTIADPASHKAEVNRGGELYRLYCSGCHSATGRGGALTSGPNAPNIAQYPAAEALAAMILGRGEMPAFAGNTFDVTQQTSVALYVNHLIEPASPGGAGLWYLGPVPEGAVGALGLVVLILLAVWLAWKSRKAVP